MDSSKNQVKKEKKNLENFYDYCDCTQTLWQLLGKRHRQSKCQVSDHK